MKFRIFLLIFIFLIISLLIICCSQVSNPYLSDKGSINEGIISDGATPASNVRQLMFLLSIKIDKTDPAYIVDNSVDNIQIKLNNTLWGSFSSINYDVTDMTEDVYNNHWTRIQKFQYQVIARYPDFDATGDLTTHQVSAYLNGALDFGEYIFEITDLTIHSPVSPGSALTIKPHYLKYFKISESSASIYIGEVDLTIKF